VTDFEYTDLLPLGEDTTTYRTLSTEGVSTFEANGETFLKVEPEAIQLLTSTAMRDIAHYLRPAHLEQLSSILDDDEASPNDHFVATELLQNANIAAGGVLPMCQDTGTAIVMGKKGERVFTGANDEEVISRGIFDTYLTSNLRYSQLAPLSLFEEKNTGNNLPAQIELYATQGDEYKFLFIAKGGGSANKTYLFQETKALLNPASLMQFLDIHNLKTAKYASTHYLDSLPTEGSMTGHGYRDLEWEERILELTRELGIGAQFGGKYFCHDVRVIRLPRHGASNPVGIAVSCSADRQALGKITKDGVFLEELETDPARYLPDVTGDDLSTAEVKIDLNRPMDEIRAELTKHPVKTRLSLSGTLVVGRDIVHAKIKERLDNGEPMPEYLQNHPIYYAGPAKTPEGYASGSFGPTTAGRMDSYVEQFQAAGGSLVMLAKGNRSQQVVDACNAHGGFYLGSIGGPAARLAKDAIRKVEVLEYEELGMEAVWRIEVEDFPAFIIIDDKGNDFFAEVSTPVSLR